MNPTINMLMKNLNMTPADLALESGVAPSTVRDICDGKAQLEKCRADTLYKIAHALDISLDELIEWQINAPEKETQVDYDIFRLHIFQAIGRNGMIDFLTDALERDLVPCLWQHGWRMESLYMLAVIDFYSRLLGVSICNEYDNLRELRLPHPIYAGSILESALTIDHNLDPRNPTLTCARHEAIPEFMRHGMVETTESLFTMPMYVKM